MNEQNQQTPEQYRQPKLSAEAILRLGGSAVSTSVEQPDFDHMVMTPEIRKEADEILAEADAMVENPPLIDSVPGYAPSVETPSTPPVEHGHVVRDVPMPADPWNRAIGYREAMQKAMRTPAEGVSQPSGLSQETTDRLNGQQ